MELKFELFDHTKNSSNGWHYEENPFVDMVDMHVILGPCDKVDINISEIVGKASYKDGYVFVTVIDTPFGKIVKEMVMSGHEFHCLPNGVGNLDGNTAKNFKLTAVSLIHDDISSRDDGKLIKGDLL